MIAPLFGTHFDLKAISAIAQKHNLLLVEDLAQAFVDAGFRGAPEADVALFSFGLIKTRTALSGAVLFARDPQLLNAIEGRVRSFPRVSTIEFWMKWARAVALKVASQPLLFRALWRMLERRGVDPDVWLSGATRGMNEANWLASVRKRPHRATLYLLRRRLHQKPGAPLQTRIERGKMAVNRVPNTLGAKARHHAFWVLPVPVNDRDALIERARASGFDLSFRASSLRCFGKETPFTHALQKSVFLPVGTPMPDSEWTRLLDIVRDASE